MTLARTRHKMPAYIRAALAERGLMGAYQARPDYQQNDYIGWITRAKRDDTKGKRLAQMLDELEGGNRYMNMKWTKAIHATIRFTQDNVSLTDALFNQAPEKNRLHETPRGRLRWLAPLS